MVYKVNNDVDSKHKSRLLQLQKQAFIGNSEFANWARRAEKESDLVYSEILQNLGNISPQKSWDVFAKIYNEDTPDNVFTEAVKFIDKILGDNGVKTLDLIIDVACGTGSISRLLAKKGYKNIIGFDRSEVMLTEAKRLCTSYPQIKLVESEISNFKPDSPAKGMVWLDFSSNFALTKQELKSWLNNLIRNLDNDGILIFDVRTKTGWNINFFKQKVTIFETENFQRLWVNLPDHKKQHITFDIFIRTKDKNCEWLPWEREQMTERMWSLDEVVKIVKGINTIELTNIYKDDFSIYNKGSREPGLAYLVIKKKA